MKQALSKLLIWSLMVTAGTGPVLAYDKGAEPVSGPINITDWRDLFTTGVVGSDKDFGSFIDKYIGILLAVAGVAAVIFIVYYSYLMITAQGKEDQFEKAKKGLLASVIGIIIVILSVFIAVAARNLALGTI